MGTLPSGVVCLCRNHFHSHHLALLIPPPSRSYKYRYMMWYNITVPAMPCEVCGTSVGRSPYTTRMLCMGCISLISYYIRISPHIYDCCLLSRPVSGRVAHTNRLLISGMNGLTRTASQVSFACAWRECIYNRCSSPVVSAVSAAVSSIRVIATSIRSLRHRPTDSPAPRSLSLSEKITTKHTTAASQHIRQHNMS